MNRVRTWLSAVSSVTSRYTQRLKEKASSAPVSGLLTVQLMRLQGLNNRGGINAEGDTKGQTVFDCTRTRIATANRIYIKQLTLCLMEYLSLMCHPTSEDIKNQRTI